MSVTLFPIIQPQSAEVDTKLPLYREVKWDYENNEPVFKNGLPVIVTGKDAILVWAWKALNTPRFKHEIYTWDFGCEAEALVGQPFTGELKRSEAARYVRECLLVTPYITGVTDVSVSFTEGVLTVGCKIETIYGEVQLNV